ncbi:ubiquitin thioesterase otub1-like, partial [Nannochloropsis oceanica]
GGRGGGRGGNAVVPPRTL